MPPTLWVEQPMSSRGVEVSRLMKTTVVHNLLAPFTDRFSRRIKTPPRTVPSTASGIHTPPEGDQVECQASSVKKEKMLHRALSSQLHRVMHIPEVPPAPRVSPIIMVEKEMVWLNCRSMNLAMKVARPASSAAWLTWATTTSR